MGKKQKPGKGRKAKNMAQVLLINSETARDGLQYIDDVVGVYDDSHQFSPDELIEFNILTVGGSREDVQAKFMEISPNVCSACIWESDGDYHWNEPEPGTGGSTWIDVFKINNKWYVLEEKFKFPCSFSSLTPEEKQILESVDINHPSVASFINKIAKDVSILPGNTVEAVSLRNTDPPVG